MKIHLIVNPAGKVFGLYVDGRLIRQRPEMTIDDLLMHLSIVHSIIAFSEEDMEEISTLPESVEAIPITGLLAESATLATLEEAARKREEKPASDPVRANAKGRAYIIQRRMQEWARQDIPEKTWHQWIIEEITSQITAAENAKAEEMRERCAKVAQTIERIGGFQYWQQAADAIEEKIRALPIEERKKGKP